MSDLSWPKPLAGAALLAAAFVAIALARTPEPGVTVRDLRLTSPRGESVPALWITASDADSHRGTALLAHGISASKETMRQIAEALARAGFVCCVIDLPSHGASTTPHPLSANAINDAFAAGALALARDEAAMPGRPPSVDVLVGHSFGAWTGARALEGEILAAKLFVAVGSMPGAGCLKADRVLFVSGRYDELITPGELRQHAADLSEEVQVEIVPNCEHALEPFDPQVSEYILDAACVRSGAGEPRRLVPVAEALPIRFVGMALLFTVAVGGIFFLPRTESRLGAVSAGLGGGALVVAAAVVGLHGMTLYLAPTGARFPIALVSVAVAYGLCLGLSKLLARVPRVSRGQTLVTHLSLMGLMLLLATISAVAGWRFLTLVLGLLTLLFAAGAIVGLLVRRRTGSEIAAHLAFAVVVGYVQGAWVGGLA